MIKGNLVTLKNVTAEQMAMLAELLIHGYQDNNFGFFADESNTPHDLNIWFETDDVTIQETAGYACVAFSVLKETNDDPADEKPSKGIEPRCGAYMIGGGL